MFRSLAKITLLTACLLPMTAAGPRGASASDWRFRQSYHSHHIPREYRPHFPVPQSRSAYRPAYITPTFGFRVQSGFRINRVQINSGTSSDTTIRHEGWFRAR